MDTLNITGSKLFVLAVLKEHYLWVSFTLFYLFTQCSVSVNILQIVFSNSSYEITVKWKAYQIFKKDRLVVHI